MCFRLAIRPHYVFNIFGEFGTLHVMAESHSVRRPIFICVSLRHRSVKVTPVLLLFKSV